MNSVRSSLSLYSFWPSAILFSTFCSICLVRLENVGTLKYMNISEITWHKRCLCIPQETVTYPTRQDRTASSHQYCLFFVFNIFSRVDCWKDRKLKYSLKTDLLIQISRYYRLSFYSVFWEYKVPSFGSLIYCWFNEFKLPVHKLHSFLTCVLLAVR